MKWRNPVSGEEPTGRIPRKCDDGDNMMSSCEDQYLNMGY
jgi:hypothetical protein